MNIQTSKFFSTWCLLFFLLIPFKNPLCMNTDSGVVRKVKECVSLWSPLYTHVDSTNHDHSLKQSGITACPYSHTPKIVHFINNIIIDIIGYGDCSSVNRSSPFHNSKKVVYPFGFPGPGQTSTLIKLWRRATGKNTTGFQYYFPEFSSSLA